jgi:peptide/nickel transport system substrate-binding protein
VVLLFSGCGRKPDPNTLVMIIESSPTNLDPRVGVDAQSERIDDLLFDSLVRRDEHFNLKPWLAESWEIPDPLTYVFHLHRGVRFDNGQLLTSRDVKWTFDSLLSGKIRSAKTSTYAPVSRIDAPDDYTVIFHLKQPFAPLLWNLSDGASGIVPYGSGEDFNRHPVGSGPFRFVSAQQDKEVVIERNPSYWATPAKLDRVEFKVIPDATTRALELRKQSADVAINSLVADTVVTLERDRNLTVMESPGTIYAYLALNLRDPILKDVRVRRAIAYAVNVQPIIQYLLRDEARPAYSVLPPQHWAYDGDVERYPHDPERAREILDAAGYRPVNGVRFHLTMKTSTEESTRLLAAVLQQQLRQVGIALDIRTFEFATFFADISKGAYQMHSLRWVGGNLDPDIFEHIFDSASFAPKRANRTFYSNPRLDELIREGRSTLDEQKRKAIYGEIQQILARDLPYINLWYLDNVLVHNNRVRGIELGPAGNYEFLRTAELTTQAAGIANRHVPWPQRLSFGRIQLGNRRDVMRTLATLAMCSCLIILVSMLASGSQAAAGENRVETWGGRGVTMKTNGDGATLEFDCAQGKILQPLKPNAGGDFTARGTYTQERGGPVLKASPPSDVSATYRGSVHGDTMRLEIVLAGQDQPLPALTLVRGQTGRVVKCR